MNKLPNLLKAIWLWTKAHKLVSVLILLAVILVVFLVLRPKSDALMAKAKVVSSRSLGSSHGTVIGGGVTTRKQAVNYAGRAIGQATLLVDSLTLA